MLASTSSCRAARQAEWRRRTIKSTPEPVRRLLKEFGASQAVRRARSASASIGRRASRLPRLLNLHHQHPSSFLRH